MNFQILSCILNKLRQLDFYYKGNIHFEKYYKPYNRRLQIHSPLSFDLRSICHMIYIRLLSKMLL